VPVGSFRTWVKYTEVSLFPNVRRHFAVLRCNHCTSAPCVTICPVTALHKRKDGIVDLDRDVCIGCKACMQACPYDALYLNEEKGCAEKCHFCAHRIEQNLEPACVVVCPERAILVGDFSNPNDPVTQMKQRQDALVRRAEQGTGPNVTYVGAHKATLDPGKSKEPTSYLWSERREAPPDWPQDRPDVYPNTTHVLDVHHQVVWGWKVNLYLVTKGIGAGAALLAPFLHRLGVTGFAELWLPELLALVFTSITTLLLVADLKRPAKFLSLLLRPNTKSWLVKGAWVLMSFSGAAFVALAARWLGYPAVADATRWVCAFLAIFAAGYTAFLFAQCEGRDLWQHQTRLFPHLLAQAVLGAAVAFLPFAQNLPLAWIALGAALCHLAFALLDAFGKHSTDNARQAALLLPRIPLRKGSKLRAFSEGLQFTTAAALLCVVLAGFGFLHAPVATLLAVATWMGLYWFEQAFVRAGQLPPLS